MKSGHRIERLQAEMRRELSRILSGYLKDPRLGHVTINRVELSRDLRHGKVLVGILGDLGTVHETLAVLRAASPRIRREIGKRMRIRRAPELVFERDMGVEHSMRVSELLREVQAAPPRDPEEDGIDAAGRDPAG